MLVMAVPTSRRPHAARAADRLRPRSPARSRSRKNPTPAKIASGTNTYSMWRYGMRTCGATTIPKAAERSRAISHAVTSAPSRQKSRNFRPDAENGRSATRGPKNRGGGGGSRNGGPGARAHREDERKDDLAPRPRASLPRSGESAHDDRTDDHYEQEVDGQMVRYD